MNGEVMNWQLADAESVTSERDEGNCKKDRDLSGNGKVKGRAQEFGWAVVQLLRQTSHKLLVYFPSNHS